MKWRVIDLETGEEIVSPDSSNFSLSEDGILFVDYWSGYSDVYNSYGHILEFAFSKDDQGEWIWSHSVLSD